MAKSKKRPAPKKPRTPQKLKKPKKPKKAKKSKQIKKHRRQPITLKMCHKTYHPQHRVHFQDQLRSVHSRTPTPMPILKNDMPHYYKKPVHVIRIH